MSAADFRLERDADIGLLIWDRPNTRMNSMTFEALESFESLLRDAFADPELLGVIITSGKDSFAAGMDLRALALLTNSLSAAEISAQVLRMHQIFRQIERGFDGVTKPVVCAINGTAMGLGVEIGLACHYTLAADRAEIKIALPESKVGLFPGGGGTTRLIRRVGLLKAAPALLEGKSFSPQEAIDAGLIDAITPAERLIDEAKSWIYKATPQDLIKPWDQPGARIPGGAPYSAQGQMAFMAANAFIGGQASPHALGLKALMRAAYEGALVDFDRALQIEARHFTSLLLAPAVQAMIRTLFIDKHALEKGARRPVSAGRQNMSHIGIIGSGMMGAAIAAVAAQRGFSVTLIDHSAAALHNGEARAQALIKKAATRGILTPTQAQRAQTALKTSTQLEALHTADLVIEAASESIAVKTKIFQDLSTILKPEAVLASNTSSLRITQLAKAYTQPQNVIGLHFFSPVERMALVEVIPHHGSTPEAVASGFDFARALGKTPIIVGDTPGFYANRLIIPFLHEALRLLAEGTPPALIENITRQLGFPVGPLQLLDEVSLTLADAIDVSLGRPDPEVSQAIAHMLDAERFGRQAGAGFYTYHEGARQRLWQGLSALFPPAEQPLSRHTVEARLMLIQVLEAERALADGSLQDRREGNLGAVLGWGFAPWSGGPFAWAEQQGHAQLYEQALALAAQFGPRFTPPASLKG